MYEIFILSTSYWERWCGFHWRKRSGTFCVQVVLVSHSPEIMGVIWWELTAREEEWPVPLPSGPSLPLPSTIHSYLSAFHPFPSTSLHHPFHSSSFTLRHYPSHPFHPESLTSTIYSFPSPSISSLYPSSPFLVLPRPLTLPLDHGSGGVLAGVSCHIVYRVLAISLKATVFIVLIDKRKKEKSTSSYGRNYNRIFLLMTSVKHVHKHYQKKNTNVIMTKCEVTFFTEIHNV